MFCPNCGVKNSKKQNYCRFCGLYLRDMSKMLTSQLVFGADSDSVEMLSDVKRILDFFLSALAGMTILCGVAYFFFGVEIGKSGMKLGLIMFFVFGAVLSAIGYYQRRERSKIRAAEAARRASTEQTETKETAKLLEEKPFEPAASAIENSTELFPIENKTQRL